MTRLILVLDEKSGLPVWYDIIPGNVLDINTVMTVVNDVADSLGIEIESLVLDAGYISKELVRVFHIGTEKTVIGRCQSLMCFRNNKGIVTVETPSKQVKEYFNNRRSRSGSFSAWKGYHPLPSGSIRSSFASRLCFPSTHS